MFNQKLVIYWVIITELDNINEWCFIPHIRAFHVVKYKCVLYEVIVFKWGA